MIRLSAKKYSEKTCLIFNGKRFTFSEVNQRVNRLANTLLARGVTKGDRVALLQTDCNQNMELLLALAKIGAVLVPLSFRLVAPEIKYLVNDAECSMFFVGERYLKLVESIRQDLPSVRAYICFDGTSKGFENYEELIIKTSDAEPGVEVKENDPLTICYTSGTTGQPKGAVLSHRAIYKRAINLVIETSYEPTDIFYTASPFYHVGGFLWQLMSIYVGGTTIIIKQFELEEVVRLLVDEKVTVAFLVPAMINFILQLPVIGNCDFSNLRLIIYGAAPMPVELLRKAIPVFGCKLCNMFGQTEDTPLLVLRPEEHIVEGSERQARRLASLGKAIINIDVRVVDDEDQDVAVGAVGEIISRSDSVMLGYWKQLEATERTLKGGWLRTGDLAQVDEDGYIYLVDRKKDMLIRGGVNVYPSEIENVLYSHPKILEVAVIGVPDAEWGEAVKAVVAVKEGVKITEEDIIEFCKGKMASYKRPTSVDFVDLLPRNASGKVLKNVLRVSYWQNLERKV